MMKGGELVDRTSAKVRFSEVDALGIVWHGNFVKYLEDGRESFGEKYNLAYLDVYEKGWLMPLVKLEMDYKIQLKYKEEIIIETRFVNVDAAKLVFEYTIFRKTDMAVLLTARTIQVFVNREGELELTNPDFFLEWKSGLGLKEGL